MKRAAASRYRVVVVGCGAVASGYDFEAGMRAPGPLTHAGAWRAQPSAEVVAAADIDAQRLARFGELWGVRALYADYRAMLERERPDVVSVCVPDELHAEVVLAACASGVRALLCEKPIATNLADARRMLAACERARVVLGVNYFRRWNPTLARLRDELTAGGLGRILRVNAWYPGGLVHNGTHAIDLVRWLVGEIAHVRAVGVRWRNREDPAIDAVCCTTDDVVCMFHGCDPTIVNLLEIDILTTLARVRITANGRRLERQPVVPDPVYSRYRLFQIEPEVTMTEWGCAFSIAAADLLECLETGASPRCSGYDAYRAVEIALGARRSEETGGQVVDVMPDHPENRNP